MLKRQLDRYPGRLDGGFDRVLHRTMPLLCELGLPETQLGLQTMTEQICACMEEQLEERFAQVQPEIRYVMDYIQEHLSEELTLEQVSHAANYQKTYFSRLFKAETSCSYSDYLFQIRMLHAQEMLYLTNLQISAVAEQCGFSDFSYFSLRFRQFCGMTPREWRNSCRETPTSEAAGSEPRSGSNIRILSCTETTDLNTDGLFDQ